MLLYLAEHQIGGLIVLSITNHQHKQHAQIVGGQVRGDVTLSSDHNSRYFIVGMFFMSRDHK